MKFAKSSVAAHVLHAFVLMLTCIAASPAMILPRVNEFSLIDSVQQVDEGADDGQDNGENGGNSPVDPNDDGTTSTVTMDDDASNGEGDDDDSTDGEEVEQSTDPIRLFDQTLVAEERDVFVAAGLLPLAFNRRYLTIEEDRTPYLKNVRSGQPSAPPSTVRVPLAGGELGARWGHSLEMKLFGPGSLYWPNAPSRGEKYFSIRQPGRTWSGGVGWTNLAAVNSKSMTRGGMAFTGDAYLRTIDGGRFYPPSFWNGTSVPPGAPAPTYRTDSYFYDGQGVRYRFGMTGRLVEVAAIGNGPNDVLESISIAYDSTHRHRTLKYSSSKTATAAELAGRPWMRVYHDANGLVTSVDVLTGSESAPSVQQSVRYFYTPEGTIPIGPQTPYTELLRRVEFWDRYTSSTDLAGSPEGLVLRKAVEYQYNATGHMTEPLI